MFLSRIFEHIYFRCSPKEWFERLAKTCEVAATINGGEVQHEEDNDSD